MSAPRPVDPQALAADPSLSAFVTANAGSGKTSTLVDRVARLLLKGAAPEAILCVTYTKAAAAEMQHRLFQKLGDWAVLEDERLHAELAKLGEVERDLPRARRLFARALETPGGLKIQTIHAFCEKLLRRFPLEAGVAPTFAVLEDAAAAEVSALAREELAEACLAAPDSPLGQAYAHLAVETELNGFEAMFAAFEGQRADVAAYVEACAETGGVEADVRRRLGLAEGDTAERLAAEAMACLDRAALREACAALAGSGVTDVKLGQRLAVFAEADGAFEAYWACYCTATGSPLKSLGAKGVAQTVRDFLLAEQTRCGEAAAKIRAARMADDTLHALYLARAYAALYEGAKARRGALDFADLIDRTVELLTVRADAAWVLYKLDGGVDHVLLDEAQDTAPQQWDILRALADEFFSGAGRPGPARTVFAVGDEKQSIYSFQGARPERLHAETEAFGLKAAQAEARFENPELLVSYRSAKPILDFVDAAFREGAPHQALHPGGDAHPVRHLAYREHAPGTVDLWPLEEGEEAEEQDAWAPLDRDPPTGANKMLAGRIARAVKAMIACGEAVGVKGSTDSRAMTAGDVLILVRRRGALFHEIIRALKREEVPVGGQDRMTLSDHIVFKDLVGLVRFVLFPADDLTLAALLRSPLADVDEDGLFALAHGRKGSLWAALKARAGERREWAAARDLLAWARGAARRLGPFDFLARTLSRLDAEGRSMRQRLLTRLGREAEDAIDALLQEALKAEARGVRDLEAFAHAMAAAEVEVKREQEEAGGEVRVMTVHGAKGLEAPVVILPDTTTTAAPARGSPLMKLADGAFLWAPRKADDTPQSAAARAAREEAVAQETLRLLYVALTRARDRLIVCGVKLANRKTGRHEGCWHEVVEQAFDRLPSRPARLGELEIRRFGDEPAPAKGDEAAANAVFADLPVWARTPATPEPPAARYASPSSLAAAHRGAAPSPLLEGAGLGRFRRGDLIHRLLQVLPDVAPETRPAAARALLSREPGLSEAQAEEMIAAAFGVLDDPVFAEVFGPGSRAEAAIAGTAPDLPAGLAISGRLDRLVVTPSRVLVVDFKTNRPAPPSIEQADETYLTQMAVYVAVLRAVFPGRAVEAALVWTDGPRLMPVPENVVRERLAVLASLA